MNDDTLARRLGWAALTLAGAPGNRLDEQFTMVALDKVKDWLK